MAAKDLISVIIIFGHGNKEWLKKATDSLDIQTYGKENLEVIVEENTDHSRTIGKAWNDAVAKAKGKYCFFLGDDDFVQPEYIDSLHSTLVNTKSELPGVSCCTSYVTRFFGEGKNVKLNKSETYPTGMVETAYLLEHKFDEERVNRVDTEWYAKNKDVVTMAYWNYGYFYRGHANQVSKCGLTNHAFKNVFVCRFPHFIHEFIGTREDAILDREYDHLHVRNAEMVFCDFGTLDAVHVSNAKTEGVIKILRVHRFEAYTDNMYKMNWDGFNAVIFASNHVRRYVETSLSRTIKNAVVIPVGVSMKRFTLHPEKPKNNKIGILGYINPKKGFVMLKMLAKTFPTMEFHILGSFQNLEVKHYLTENTLPNIFITPWMDNPNSWLQDKTYILSMSLVESQQMSVLEGMACGCKPLVSEHWIGSNDIYEPGHLWGTPNELAKLINGEIEPAKYRKFVEDNYTQEAEFKAIDKLIGGCSG